MHHKIASFPILMLMIAIISCSEPESLKTEIKDGVITVQNIGRSVFDNISLEKIISIGIESGNDEYMLSGNLDIETDKNSNIYISDRKFRRLSLFDRFGMFQWAIGRQGQGPGEFQNPLDLTLNEKEKEILVLDNWVNIDVFSFEGPYLRTINLDRRVWCVDVLSNEFLFLLLHVPDRTGVLPLIFDLNGKYLKEFTTLYSYGPSRLGPGGYSPEKAFSIFDDNIYFSIPDKYEIREFDSQGRHRKTIKRNIGIEPFKIKRTNGEITQISVRDRSGPCFQVKDKYLLNIYTLSGNNVEPRKWYFDVFLLSGKYLGTFLLPEDSKLEHVDSEGYLYLVEKDPFVRVEKYKLIISNIDDQKSR